MQIFLYQSTELNSSVDKPNSYQNSFVPTNLNKRPQVKLNSNANELSKYGIIKPNETKTNEERQRELKRYNYLVNNIDGFDPRDI
jgi:hypothetical protein